MTLPAFADVEDIEVRLGRSLDADELMRAQAAVDFASTLIRVEAGTSWATDGAVDFGTLADYQQDAVIQVCIAAAARAMENPEGLESETETLGDASLAKTYANTSVDVYLTRAEKSIIHQLAGKGGLWVQPTTRGDRLETAPVHTRIEDTLDPIDTLASAQVDVRRP